MKSILILTDLSENAAHTAEFGYHFAKQVKSNIILCNAFAIPVEMPQSSLAVWPADEYDEISQSCADSVKELKEKLEEIDKDGTKPAIKCINEAGTLQDIIGPVVAKHDIGLIIMGTHGGSGLSSFILGNHARRMIDITTKPLLLVPSKVDYLPMKKIAFATDLENISGDVDAILELITYAKWLNAEILLTYVDNKKYHTPEFKSNMDEILVILSNWANYPLIYYRVVENETAELGLEWLCKHGQVAMLAMIHRHHSFLNDIVKDSHTQKMASEITKPLLVFPAKA